MGQYRLAGDKMNLSNMLWIQLLTSFGFAMLGYGIIFSVVGLVLDLNRMVALGAGMLMGWGAVLVGVAQSMRCEK